MEWFEIKKEIEQQKNKIASLGGLFDFEAIKQQIALLEEKMLAPDFWEDSQAAQQVIDELNGLKETYESFENLTKIGDDIELMVEMLEEEMDQDLQKDLQHELKKWDQAIRAFELKVLLSEPYDRSNAILELHPGAGGTESQDFGEMLYRMYTRWITAHHFKYEVIDYQAGDEAGLKSVTIKVQGPYAYGMLKAEKGVHRLVRISPFDSGGRRHTSFVSCDVIPEMPTDVEVEINPEDLKIDTYRSSGAGGQHVNVTDSAVRITHLPTGIVVTSQAGRSQLANRQTAMELLKAKIYQKEMEEKAAQLAEIRGEQKEIGWGSQIRSYVFHPYSMVKDHRTNEETGNVDAVMDGGLDPFIEAYLKWHIHH
ncbi:peptide chain release factor 2 [Allofustis seminis]|uniref:peptide chain release factor 2 n=1 Tax=Allofustis seminis TaxID=166939 RepID=UPI003CCC0823